MAALCNSRRHSHFRIGQAQRLIQCFEEFNAGDHSTAQKLRRSLSIISFMDGVGIEGVDNDDATHPESGSLYPERTEASGLFANQEAFADTPLPHHVDSSEQFEFPGFAERSESDDDSGSDSEDTMQDGLGSQIDVQTTAPSDTSSPIQATQGSSDEATFISAQGSTPSITSYRTARSGSGNGEDDEPETQEPTCEFSNCSIIYSIMSQLTNIKCVKWANKLPINE